MEGSFDSRCTLVESTHRSSRLTNSLCCVCHPPARPIARPPALQHHYCGDTPSLSTPLDVVTYLRQTEAAVPFLAAVPKSEKNYYAAIRKPVDLGAIAGRARAGAYAEAPTTEEELAAAPSSAAVANRGVAGLWEDLGTLIKNARQFNQVRRATGGQSRQRAVVCAALIMHTACPPPALCTL